MAVGLGIEVIIQVKGTLGATGSVKAGRQHEILFVLMVKVDSTICILVFDLLLVLYRILYKKVVLDQGYSFPGDRWQCLVSLAHTVPNVSNEAEKG